MKKIFKFTSILVLCLTFALVGCKKQYEKTVDQYMKEELDDPNSYEPISYSNHPYSANQISSVYLLMTGKGLEHVNKFQQDISVIFKSRGKSSDDVLFNVVEVEYRANNKYGAKEKQTMEFILDKDMKKVLEICTPEKTFYRCWDRLQEVILLDND